MKRVLSVISLILLLAVSIAAANLFITVNGNYFSIADSAYKERYGDTKYFPEGKIALTINGNIYLWGSFGFLSSSYNWLQWSDKSVVEQDIEGESIADKFIVSGGLGYYVGYIRPKEFAVSLEVGLCSITNSTKSTLTKITSKELLDVNKIKESGIGIRGNFGISYGIYKNFFSEASIGYLYATDKVDDRRVKLGGLRLALGLGIKL